MELTPKERVLGLFAGREIDRIPCFSGMGNVTTAGLAQYGYKFPEVHGDARKMADAAASSYRLFGYECAIVPFDLCVEAEALGAVMNTYENVDQLLYPTIKEKVIHSPEEMASFKNVDGLADRGRVPVITDAIKILQAEIGSEVAIGSYLLGPFTLAGQLMDLDDLCKLSLKKPDQVNALLDTLAGALIEFAKIYRNAGVDYICIREMGATNDVLSANVFRKVIYPHLKKLFEAVDYPAILHICGSTNSVMKIMHECGADAISVETKNDLAKSREDIGDEALLFGHVNSYNVLAEGTPEDVEKGVLVSINGGVDAVWPSCDIWPTAPLENLKAMVETVKKYGASNWARKNKRKTPIEEMEV